MLRITPAPACSTAKAGRCGTARCTFPCWLSQALADAQKVGEALEARGFEVTLVKNPDSKTLEQALSNFFVRKRQSPDARLFVWYAGHGHSIDAEGYLLPTDAPLLAAPCGSLALSH